MSFNFNWEPLLNSNPANPNEFYERAKVLLTAALNKSPKPPIIVDDIIVNELNLGTSAPELEILEIGDIADDRFRGIFKLSYAGDAFLELKTKVQVNPLNTYLSTIPDFISPAPVAASSPLTIPVQITLSEFRLSGFVILVFSKAKGITIVFRNDPLESLRVSSTFDSIPFIKEYLQKEIESQVRKLFQEELPVAIHKLSLRLWNPEYAESLEAEARSSGADSPTVDGASFFPDSIDNEDPFYDLRPTPASTGEDVHQPPQFSQKNLTRLAALLNSQKTLSVFTPTVPDAIYRAWAPGIPSSMSSDKASTTATEPSTPYSSTDDASSRLSRDMSTIGLSLGARRMAANTHGKKKKKHRVINLRNLTQKKDDAIPEDSTNSTAAEDMNSEQQQQEPTFEPLYSDPEKSPVFGSPQTLHHSYASSSRSPSPPTPAMHGATFPVSPAPHLEAPIYTEAPRYTSLPANGGSPMMSSYEAAAANSAIIEKVLAMKLSRELSADERGRLARQWGSTFASERGRTPPPAYAK